MLGELVLRRCTVIGEREVGVLASVGVKRIRGYKVKTIYVGSIGGIMSIKRGEADIAGIHLVDSETMEYNIPFLKKYGVDNACLIKGYMREQGIIVPKGNPHGMKDVRDIIEKNLRIVNRGWKAVSAFIIICSAHVHWFVLQLKLMSIQSMIVLMMR
jgi:putative molybdopterin biosynthesis protein